MNPIILSNPWLPQKKKTNNIIYYLNNHYIKNAIERKAYIAYLRK